MGDIADIYSFDEWDVEEPAPHTYYVGHNKYKWCKYCGIGGLHWGLTKNKWRLFAKNGKTHTCKKRNVLTKTFKSNIVRYD